MIPPLHRVRILDLTRVLAGPLCTMTLGDLGADVLKVERKGEGDETRAWGPPFDGTGESAYYLSVNRNKLGIALDLDAEDDRLLLHRLIAGADVVVDNFRPGMLERRGLDPLRLLAVHPRLLWCTLTGFGPGSTRPGYDFVVQAESGWMAITGEPDGDPMKSGVPLADVIAGKDAAIQILAALAAPERPEAPADRRLTVSLSHSATAALVNVAQNTILTGEEPARWGNAHPNLVPYQLFDTADRPIVIAVGNDAQWRSCCMALDRADLADTTAYATNPGRVTAREQVVAELSRTLLERSALEWLGRLAQHGVPAGIVRPVREALAEVRSDARSGIAPVPPGAVRRPPPRLDEHGVLLRRLGWRAFEA